MAKSFKAISMMAKFKDRVQKLLPSTFVYTDGVDADGYPTLLIAADASPATTEQVLAIRIVSVQSQFENVVLGSSAAVYSPHRVQVIAEDGTSAGILYVTAPNLVKVFDELKYLMIDQELYFSANTTVPALSMFAADGAVSSAVLEDVIPADFRALGSGQ